MNLHLQVMSLTPGAIEIRGLHQVDMVKASHRRRIHILSRPHLPPVRPDHLVRCARSDAVVHHDAALPASTQITFTDVDGFARLDVSFNQLVKTPQPASRVGIYCFEPSLVGKTR